MRDDRDVDAAIPPEPAPPVDAIAIAATKLYEAERRVVYDRVPIVERKRGKWDVDEIEPALDDMINAATRTEISCSWAPAALYFRQGMSGKWFCKRSLVLMY